MIKLLFVIILSTVASVSIAQSRFTINGQVKDVKSGEALIGATISIKGLPSIGAVSNAYGFYSISLPGGNYSMAVQSVGYISVDTTVSLMRNLRADFSLAESAYELKEIEISDKREDENILKTEMGSEKLQVRDITKIPVIMGEKDVLKTIQLLPGVKSAGEGNVGFYVRGGGVDQNLVLLDEAPIYNAGHLLGFFSVFNSDALKDVTLYKGSIPAEYGGRLSSVLDIKMNDGNNQNFNVSGGIGLISSRLSAQGPLVKNKSSFIVSARRTYADLFLSLADDEALKNSRLYFYDFNAKANYTVDNKNRFFLSGYFGKDRINVSDAIGIGWGNETATLRWNHLFSEKLFSNTSLIYSNYRYEVQENNGGNKLYTTSSIKDVNLKQDFQFFVHAGSTVKFGLNSIYHSIIPGVLTSKAGTKVNTLDLERYSLENALYASHELDAAEKITMIYGLRLSSFGIIGLGDFYTFDHEGEIRDTTRYSSGKIIQTYWNLEPRLSVNYVINQNNSVKAAYTRTSQNLHLITSSTITQPTDLWIPTSNYVRPEIADQYSLGYFHNFSGHTYEISLEGYYKQMQNQIDYKDGAKLELNNAVETELLIGEGRAYGLEFLIKKQKGRLNGWIGYTLSKTERMHKAINNGSYFPAPQDRRHDITLVTIYDLSEKWSLSASWVYYTGQAVTFPSGKYGIDGQVFNYYTERNGYRMPDYHRLDFGATWKRRKTTKFESTWNFSIYNVYARQNPFQITFRRSKTDPSRSEAVQTSLFTIIPSVTYNFKF